MSDNPNNSPGQGGTPPGRDPDREPGRPAHSYDRQYPDAKEAAESARERLHQHSNVHSVGVGPKITDGDRTGELAVVVWVDSKVPSADLAGTEVVPDTVGQQNIPTDVQEVERPTPDISPNHRRQPHNPIFGGTSSGHPSVSAGTLGGVFKDSTGAQVVLTNRHVAADGGTDSTGDNFLQPGSYDTSPGDPEEVIGTVKELGPWDSAGVNTTDSALIDPSLVDVSGVVAGLGTIGASELPSFDVTYLKSGRTTHLRASNLVATDISTTVNHGWALLDYSGLIAFDPVSSGGDSGSLWARYDRSTGTSHPVGLHFAGSSQRALAVPWSAIETAHGTLTPVTTSTPRVEQSSSGRADIAPASLSTGSSGRLPVILYNAGGIDEKEARLYAGTDTSVAPLSTELATIGWGEVGVVDLDMASHFATGTHTVTIESDSGDTQAYEAEVTAQSEYKLSIVVENGVGDSLSGATVTITETGATDTTNANGVAEIYLPDGTYTYTAELSGYDSVSGTVTIAGAAVSQTATLTATGTGSGGGIVDPITLPWTSETDWKSATARQGLVSTTFGDRSGGTLQLGWDPDYSPFATKAVGYWSLDEASGAIGDAIGTADGSDVDLMRGRQGVNRSNAIEFNGVDSHVLVSGTNVGSFGGSFAIAAVITPFRVDRNQTIWRNGDTEPGTSFLELRDNGRISFGFYDSNNNAIFEPNFHYGGLVAGKQQFIAASYDSSQDQARAWIDASAETTSMSGTRPSRAIGHDISMGYRPQRSNRPYRGLIDEVVFFDRALTNTDVQNMYNALTTGSATLARKVASSQ